MTSKRIYLSAPHMGGHELEYIHKAFADNWISPVGPHLAEFESRLADLTQSGYCAALSSGTAAIHLALKILGVKAGDEVLCQSFTFSGTCNPIAYEGAHPVFVDSESGSWNMDPGLLRTAIKDRISKTGRAPRAIIVVHLYGMPAAMDEIMNIANEFGIPVVEDAAEALGSVYNGRPCGSIGHFGILSFNGNKIITTSGGGALLSSNGEWIDRARFLATQAREPAPHYEHTTIGYNYRLSNISAGIGLGQLDVLPDRVSRRREIYELYRSLLEQTGFFGFLPEPIERQSNRWLTTVTLTENVPAKVTRESLRLALERENIESRPLWKPMHMQPVFSGSVSFRNGVSEKLFDRGLCLPSGSQMSNGEIEKTVELLVREVTSAKVPVSKN